MKNSFTNDQIEVDDLPRYELLTLEPISIKQRSKALISLTIWLLVIFIGLSIWYYYDKNFIVFYIAIAGLLFFGFQYFLIFKTQEKYGYALRERDIVFRRGFLLEKTTVIPFNRIQHVSISQGILDKTLNIATLQLFTAGGSGSDINIPGLEPERAAVVKEAIVKEVDHATR